MSGFKLAAAATFAAGAMLLISASADATTYTFTNKNFGAGSNVGNFGTVDVTESGVNTLHFDVNLNSIYGFTGGADTFAFSVDKSPIAFANFDPNTWSASNTVAAEFAMDGFGKYKYGVTAPGAGGSVNNGDLLEFDITATGLTLASLLTDKPGGGDFGDGLYYFAAHICEDTGCGQGVTGYVAATLSPIPLPAGLVLFLSGLGGLGFIGRLKAKQRRLAVA